MWQVRSIDDPARHVGWGDDGLAADPESAAALEAAIGLGDVVQLTVTGPPYTPAGVGDELGAFLLAMQTDVMPGPREIIGTPPRGEVYEIPEGAVA